MQKPINVDPENIINTIEAAKILGVSDRAVRDKIKRGTLPATKIGTQYLLNKQAVHFYMRLRAIRKRKKIKAEKAATPSPFPDRPD